VIVIVIARAIVTAIVRVIPLAKLTSNSDRKVKVKVIAKSDSNSTSLPRKPLDLARNLRKIREINGFQSLHGWIA